MRLEQPWRIRLMENAISTKAQEAKERAALLDAVDKQLDYFEKLKPFKTLKQLVRTHWAEDTEVIEVFRDEQIVNIYSALLSEFGMLLGGSPDPGRDLRRVLVHSAFHLGKYLVLIFPPRPEPDPLQIRDDCTGVTGELAPHTLELANFYAGLPNWELFDKVPGSEREAEVRTYLEYLVFAARFAVLSSLCASLERKPQLTDQFFLCVLAACSVWEIIHREALDLPEILEPGTSKEVYQRYTWFLNLVEGGAPDPVAALLAERINSEGGQGSVTKH